MERHNTNGLAVARFLAAHPKVRTVHYPGLEQHPQHALAQRQMRGFGAKLAFDVDTLERAKIVLERFRVFALAESLGGVESLVCHPASMTHASVPIERRAQIGLTESMVRLSVGIEDVNDLVAGPRAHGLSRPLVGAPGHGPVAHGRLPAPLPRRRRGSELWAYRMVTLTRRACSASRRSRWS
jgi:hypothetical protein